MHFSAYAHVYICINAFALSHFHSDGQKMSKRKKNYPDPGLIVQNYGADALRLDLCFSVRVFMKHECLCADGRFLCL